MRNCIREADDVFCTAAKVSRSVERRWRPMRNDSRFCSRAYEIESCVYIVTRTCMVWNRAMKEKASIKTEI